MKLIALQDANILIDLVNMGLFDHCLSLHYQFTTTNIILDELYEHQVRLIQPHINSGKFTIIQIDADSLINIQIATLEDTRLSEQDWSALYYAKQLDAILLTGDKRMRSLAKAKDVMVCGVLWILDQLVETSKLTQQEACVFLHQLISKNKRLPADECEQRMKLWCGSITPQSS
jgi:predicted nucleic acid-binding protein